MVSSGLLYWMAWLAFGRCGTTSFFRFPLLVDTPEIPHKLHFDLLCIGQKFHLIVLFAKARLRLVYLVWLAFLHSALLLFPSVLPG